MFIKRSFSEKVDLYINTYSSIKTCKPKPNKFSPSNNYTYGQTLKRKGNRNIHKHTQTNKHTYTWTQRETRNNQRMKKQKKHPKHNQIPSNIYTKKDIHKQIQFLSIYLSFISP